MNPRNLPAHIILVCSMLFGAGPPVLAQDCNDNGVDDSIDVAGAVRFRAEDLLPVARVSSLVLAELNGDGILDVASTVNDAEIEVRTGRGDGTFGSPAVFPLGGDPAGTTGDLIALDIDGDGRTDLAKAIERGSSVAVLLGTGDGGLGPPLLLQVGPRPTTLAGGDVTADGIPDIVSVNTDGLSLLRGRGDGTFDDARDLGGPGAPTAVAIADLDDDDLPDLLVAQSGELLLHFGAGGGAFREPRVVDVPGVTAILPADVDGDGRLDIVVAQSAARDVVILVADGEGAFRRSGVYRVGEEPDTLAAADLDGDGRSDLISVNRGGGSADQPATVSVLGGRGGGTFGTPRTLPLRGSFVRSPALGDLDGDGVLDIAAAASTALQISITHGERGGAFASPTVTDVAATPQGLEAGDFDEDGVNDVVLGAGEEIWILRGNGHGGFPVARRFSAGRDPVDLAVADFDGDGHLDVASANLESDDVTVLLGDGDGALGDASAIPVGREPVGIVAADLDGDGVLDLATANRLSEEVSILTGRGDGNFDAASTLPTGAPARALVATDFDGDRLMDLAVLVAGADVAILLGVGAGAFRSGDRYPVAEEAVDLVAPDIDGDGDADLLAAHGASGGLSLLENIDDATFVWSPLATTDSGAHRVVAHDFNGDGQMDLAVLGAVPGTVALLQGAGEMVFELVFERRQAFVAGRQTTALAVSDLDLDGRPDLIIGTSTAPRGITAALNDSGSREDCNRNGVPDACDLAAGTSADSDGDGVPDECSAPRPLLEDCNRNGFSDESDLVSGASLDCDGNEVPDDCDLAPGLDYARDDIPTVDLFAVVKADLEGDRVDDLVGIGPGALHLFRGEAKSFVPLGPLPVGTRPSAALARDLNGDGRLDLAAVSAQDSVAAVLLAAPDGSFGDAAIIDLAVPGGLPARFPLAIAALDFDLDGDVDLATANGQTETVSLLAGAGDGSFETGPQLSLPLGSRQPVSLIAVDVDVDGATDLATANAFSDDVTVFFAGSGGSFDGVNFPVGRLPRAVAAADLDHDGLLDLATLNGESISVLLQRPDRVFEAAATRELGPITNLGAFSGTLVATDLDGDGHVDLAGADVPRDGVAILLGNGDGTFRPTLRVATGLAPRSVVALDLGRNGTIDLVTTTELGLSVLQADLTAPLHGDCDLNRVPDDCDLASGSRRDDDGNGILDVCESSLQLPGDCNQDGVLDIADPLCLLSFLFEGEPRVLPCGDRHPDHPGNVALLDTQPNGMIDISDGIFSLHFLFLGGPAHPLAVAGAETSACVPLPGCVSRTTCP